MKSAFWIPLTGGILAGALINGATFGFAVGARAALAGVAGLAAEVACLAAAGAAGFAGVWALAATVLAANNRIRALCFMILSNSLCRMGVV